MGGILKSDNKIIIKKARSTEVNYFCFLLWLPYGYSDLKYSFLIFIDTVLLDHYYFLNNILKYLITLY